MATDITPITYSDLRVIYDDPRYEDLIPLFEYIFEKLEEIRKDNDDNH